MKNLQKIKQEKKQRRHLRVRAKVFGTAHQPRLSVSRSIKHTSAQLIDDASGRTLISISDAALGKRKVGKRKIIIAAPPKELGEKSSKVAIAYEVGKLIAEKAKEMNIKSVVFDRGGFKYHGRIKAVAEGAREGGLEF
jgi:large subunit ribosomal protein L18